MSHDLTTCETLLFVASLLRLVSDYSTALLAQRI